MIRNVIKERRKELKMSLAKFAHFTGIPRSTLGEYERHQMLIPQDRVKIICEVLEIDESELFKKY